jgi:hypothetical protein
LLQSLLDRWLGVYAVVKAPPSAPGVESPFLVPGEYWVIGVTDSIPREFEGRIAFVGDGRLYGIGSGAEPSYYLERGGVTLEVVLPPPPLQRGP